MEIEFTGRSLVKGSTEAAGYDLCADKGGSVEPHETAVVATGTSVALNEGMVGLVCSRSGLAAKKGVYVLNAPGIVDSDYRGEIKVILHNLGNDTFRFNAGDRIAQLVVQYHAYIDFVRVGKLRETERGRNGLGSTGTGAIK